MAGRREETRKTVGVIFQAARRYYDSKKRQVTAYSAGDRPGGWEEGYICSIRSLVRSFVDVRLSMLSVVVWETLESVLYL